MNRRLLVVSIGFMAHLAAVPAWSQQGQDASLVGTVRDSSGEVVAGARVIVLSPRLIGGSRAAVTDSGGAYGFLALSPGKYDVVTELAGFKTATHPSVTLLPGATVTADVVLSPADLQETVHVTGNVSSLDVRTSAASTVVDRTLLDNLPLSRTVSDYVNLVPGVVGFSEVGVVAFGGSSMSNPFTLDGASGNEPGWGTPTTSPSASWIEEVQVVAVGADAQFGEYTGAPMNAITRSGSNALAGGVDYWMTRTNWVADNRGTLTPNLAARFRPLDVLDRWSTTAQLGGPFRRDRLWFFGGVDVYRNVNRPAGFASIANPPADAASSLMEPKWFGKVTASPRPLIRFEVYVAHDLSTLLNANASPTVEPTALTANRRPELLWNTRFTWVVNDHTLVEAQQGGHNTHDTSGPLDPSGIAGPPGHYDSATRLASVNATYYSDSLTRPIGAAVAVTHYTPTAAHGTHHIKAGFEYEHDHLRSVTGFPGGMVFYDTNGEPDTVDIQAPTINRPDHHRETLYVQDAWSAANNVTVNAGVRVGFYRGAITGYPTQFAASSIAPRIGVAWDVLPEHTMAVRAHYGRYHEAMVTSFYDFLDPLSQPVDITAKVIGPNQFSEVSRDDTYNRLSVDPKTRYPYADEWVAGIDGALPRGISLTAQYVGRRYGSIVGFVGPMSDWTPVQVHDPGPDGVPGTADDGGPLTIYYNSGANGFSAVLTNPEGAYKRYNGLQLIATRRAIGRWTGEASYTWSHTRASFDTAFSSNAANNDLSVNGVYVNPNRALYAAGRPAADFTHEVKVVGTVELPWLTGLRVSGVYRYQSGRAWNRLVAFNGPTQLFAEAVEPRGAREAHAPSVLDLRVEKSFKAGPSKVGAYADVFNVTNQGIANRYYQISGPSFGTPNSWSNPRILRAGLRVTF